MWQLAMQNAAKDWVTVGEFDTLAAATRRIRELEGRASGAEIDLELHVETALGTDEEAFSVLHHTGRHALYRIRRRKN